MEHILRRLRESRMNEAQGTYDYIFRVPWRESITYGEDDASYQYDPQQMDYAGEIMDAATSEFNEIDWTEYTAQDSRTEDCGIISMNMDFSPDAECLITVTTNELLDEDQISDVISYLEGQMSDGWGEGFEQRDIATYTDENEEWIEDPDDEDGGYYDTVESRVYVNGQFWWTEEHRPWDIDLVSSASDGSLKEDTTPSVESHDGWEYWEMPKNYGGPWTATNYAKDYMDLYLTIYPPQSVPGDEPTSDWHAQIEDIHGDAHIDQYQSGFNSFEDAEAWINKWLDKHGYNLEESIEEDYEHRHFPTESEAYEYAEENGYEIDKTQDCEDRCKAWFRKKPIQEDIEESQSSPSALLYDILNDLGIRFEDISEDEDGVVYVSNSEPYDRQTLNKIWSRLEDVDSSGFEDQLHTMWFSF